MRCGRPLPFVALALVLACAFPRSVVAQGDVPTERVEAAEAYDRGVRAFRARDFPAAGRWFEQAYRLAPSPAALVQAMRAYSNARDVRRAGTLALALEDAVGLSHEAAQAAARARALAARRFVRVDAFCSGPCELVVAGEPQPFFRFFVEAGRPVEIVARYDGGSRSATVEGRAGATQQVAFDTPVPPPAAEEPAEPELDLTLEEGENPYRISRLRFLSRPRATFFVFTASSTVVYGISTWAGLERGDIRQRYRRMVASGSATAEELAVAEDRLERATRRARGYFGFSATVAATSVFVAAFTDWTPHGNRREDEEGDSSDEGTTLVPGVTAGEGEAGVFLRGTF